MKLNSHVLRVSGVVTMLAALTACAQPRQEAARTAPAEDAVSLLTHQVQSLERYTAQMEQRYAAQEAEILRLRQEVAALRSTT